MVDHIRGSSQSNAYLAELPLKQRYAVRGVNHRPSGCNTTQTEVDLLTHATVKIDLLMKKADDQTHDQQN